jgi:hypothetical protein
VGSLTDTAKYISPILFVPVCVTFGASSGQLTDSRGNEILKRYTQEASYASQKIAKYYMPDLFAFAIILTNKFRGL